MNDLTDLERDDLLRTELQGAIVPPDAPDRLVRRIERLGLEPVAISSESNETMRPAWRRWRRTAGAFAGVAAALALLVGSLVWRPSAGQPSSSGPAVSAPPSRPVPSDASPWHGAPFQPASFSALGGNLVWAVSRVDAPAHETLIVSEDGGTTWRSSTLPVEPMDVPNVPHGGFGRQHLYPVPHRVVFTDADHAFFLHIPARTANPSGSVVPQRPQVFRSSDGGRTWTSTILGPAAAGSAVGSTPIAAISSFGSGDGFLYMLDAQHGWVSAFDGDVSMYATSDGGATWRLEASTPDLYKVPQTFAFTSTADGYGIGFTRGTGGGYATLLRTRDGGRTWTRIELPLPTGFAYSLRLDGAPRGSGSELRLVGMGLASTDVPRDSYSAVVTWRSADGGDTWQIVSTDSASIDGVVGDPTGHDSSIVKVANGTTTAYLADPSGAISPFNLGELLDRGQTGSANLGSAIATGATSAWVLVNGDCDANSTLGAACPVLARTGDGGKTWQTPLGDSRAPQNPVPPCCGAISPLSGYYQTGARDAAWLDSTHGWAVVGTTLRWTADGGRTWTASGTLPAGGALQFLDPQHGWLAATLTADPTAVRFPASNPVYRTDDGGRTWKAATLPALDYWEGWSWLHFGDIEHGLVARCDLLIAGQSLVACRMFETGDGGTTFHEIGTQNVPAPIVWDTPTIGHGVTFMDGASVFAWTADGGRTWSHSALQLATRRNPWSARLLAGSFDGHTGRLLVAVDQYDSQPQGATPRDPAVTVEFTTSDGGASWTAVWQGPEVQTRRADLAGDALVGIRYDAGAILISSDFGRTWATRSLPQGVGQGGTANGLTAEPSDVAFGDARNGVLVVTPAYPSAPSAIYVTHDGGASWQLAR